MRDLTDLMQPETLRIVNEELLPDEMTLQLESITDMLLAMSKNKRDEIEAIISTHYDAYQAELKAEIKKASPKTERSH
jgi:hypothetical protein